MGEEVYVSEETAIHGWNAIARLFGVSTRSMMRRRRELLEAGVIFYMQMGQPRKRVVSAFPSALKAWISLKSAKGEDF